MSWGATAKSALAYGASSAFVAVFAYATARLAPFLKEAYWAPIAAIVVLYPNREATTKASLERFAGTFIGSAIGWASASLWHDRVLVYGAFVVLAVALCILLRLENASRLCAVAVTVITIIPRAAPPDVVAVHRFLEVSYGVACALVYTVAVDAIRRRRARFGLPPSAGP